MSIAVSEGDCRDILATLPEASIDACVTDPPYGISFMGKDWDSPGGLGDFPMRRNHPQNMVNTGVTRQGGRQRSCADFARRQLRDSRAFGEWCGAWAIEVFRVLKPGAHLIAFGGTRTYHRLACAIEDAGFEIRDQIGWAFGSGFPKSHNLGGDWQGWGTALKPAWEPIVLARKPLVGTVAANVQQHGTGALNIDGCRIETAENLNGGAYSEVGNRTVSGSLHAGSGMNQPGKTTGKEYVAPSGRWPANLIHDGSEEVLAAFPQSDGAAAPVKGTEKSTTGQNGIYGHFERVSSGPVRLDSGSAARFFYSSKADATDRLESKHPTVKPVDLMAYLCRLICPPGGTVLDPFAGSGTTGMACMREGFNCILIEREAAYVADIRRRLDHVHGNDTPLFSHAAVSR